MANHAHAITCVPGGNELPRWKSSRWIKVATRVRTVNTKTLGIEIRALTHAGSRSSARAHPDPQRLLLPAQGLQIQVDHAYGDGTLADGRGDALGGSSANVAGGEHTRHAGLEQHRP